MVSLAPTLLDKLLSRMPDDQKWEDDMTDDKHRRVRHQLEHGDVIQEVRNVTRVTGVDASRWSTLHV